MYMLTQSKIKNEDGKEIDTYGISFGNIDIKDISINKSKVEKLVKLCNNFDLSPLHIYDVIEDFLVDLEV